MPGPTVLTIILNYKTPDMTLMAAEAALREMDGIDGAVTIVDNDSQDGSFEALCEAARARGWSRVRVLQSGRNGGFGAGNNFGIRAGLPGGQVPDFLYILNPDAFPDKGALRALLDHMETHPATGFAGSYIHGPDGHAHCTAFRFPTVWSELEGAARSGPVSRLLAKHVVPLGVPDATRRVDWLAGASLIMRRTVLDQIGLFDETFFLYFEETDLCRRAARAGWPTVYVRESAVTHIGSVSTGMKTWARMPQYWFDSRWHYFSVNHGRAYAMGATGAHLLGGLIWRARRLLQGKPAADPARFLRDLVQHDLRSILRGTAGRRTLGPGIRPSPAQLLADRPAP